MSAFIEVDDQQCTDCGHWRDGPADVFVYVFAEDRQLCGPCCNARWRLLHGEPAVEVDLVLEEDGALEDMIEDYSDLPLFAYGADVQWVAENEGRLTEC